MKTIILPGYSARNKEWADGLASQMNLGHEIFVHEWRHWTSGSFSIPKELEKISEEINDKEVNLLAKSVGTMMAMRVLVKPDVDVNKIVLCGIPSVSDERLDLFKKALRSFPPGKIICFQNEKDPLANFDKVASFIKKVNPEIKIVKKQASSHNYPYAEDFEKFLKT